MPLEEGVTVQLTNVDNIWAHPTFDTYSVNLSFESGESSRGDVNTTGFENPVQTQTSITVTEVSSTENKISFGSGTDAKSVTATAKSGYNFDHWGLKINGEDEVEYNPEIHKVVVDPTVFIAHFSTFPIKVTFTVEPFEGPAGGYFDIQDTPTQTVLDA